MQDIASEADIKTLIDAFYRKVLVDTTIGFIFNEVIALSWEKHIPIMYSFWSSLLLGKGTYAGNPMLKHLELDQKIRLEKEHFSQWLKLWEETVQENFEGKISNEAISRAKNIAALMLHKISQQRSLKNS